jgi:putative intracellular protease/amidase
MTRLLMVVTGADGLTLKDGTILRTGFWAEELVVPHELFRQAGIDVDAATPGGVAAPVDPKSLEPNSNVGGQKVIDHFKQYLARIDDVKLGADFRVGKPWLPNVIAGRNLITGQNPASSFGLAETAIGRLSAATPR